MPNSEKNVFKNDIFLFCVADFPKKVNKDSRNNRRCSATMAIWRFLRERLMTALTFENVNIYILLLKMWHLKPVATRHQLQGSIIDI